MTRLSYNIKKLYNTINNKVFSLMPWQPCLNKISGTLILSIRYDFDNDLMQKELAAITRSSYNKS